jgi:hypothetical protein
MSIIIDIENAKTRLSFEIQSTLPPVLADADLEAILSKVERATIWTAATAYALNDVVIPATQNGLRFICVSPGTTGATEPVWPTQTRGVTGDGDAVWEEAGNQYDLWDMDAAIHEGWKIKKSMAVVYIGSDDGLGDVYDHCADMADRSKPVGLA